MVTSVSGVSSSSSVMKTTASKVATTAKSTSRPTVNVSALARLFQAQVPVKTLEEALAINPNNKAALKVPFNLTLNQKIENLSRDNIIQLNRLVDAGVIASVKPAVNPTTITISFADMQRLSKLLPKLAPPSNFTLTSDRISATQALSFTTDMMKKLASPVTVADDPLNLSQGAVWTKLGQMANTGALKTLQLTGTTSNELQLTYEQLKGGSNILSKIGVSYQISVRDVTAANANSVATLSNVRRVNIRDNIDSIMFLGSNIQKISNQQKLGTITTTSAPIDIEQPLSYLKSHLGVIGSLADADKLSSLRLTDLPSGTLSLSSVEIARNAKALGILLNNPGPFVLDNSGPVTAQQAKDIATLLQERNNVSLSRPLQIADTASSILAAQDSFFGEGAPAIGSIKILGDVNVAQASQLEMLGSNFTKFDSFRIVDTAENALNLDLTPSDHSTLNSKISGIRVTSALNVDRLVDIYELDSNQDLVINFSKGNVLAKLLSGLEISGLPQDITSQTKRLAKLASDGKLRSINATVTSNYSINSVTEFQKSLRNAKLSDYPLSLSIADPYSSFLPSEMESQRTILENLKQLNSTGLIKSIYVASQGQAENLTISRAATLSSKLDSIGLANKIMPMSISVNGIDFGVPIAPIGANVPPHYFPNLAVLSSLIGKGKILIDSLSPILINDVEIPAYAQDPNDSLGRYIDPNDSDYTSKLASLKAAIIDDLTNQLRGIGVKLN